MKKLFAMMMALLMAVSLMCSASALSLNDVQKKVDGILYADVIKNLKKGQGYAFVPVADKGFDALIVADNVKANKAGVAVSSGYACARPTMNSTTPGIMAFTWSASYSAAPSFFMAFMAATSKRYPKNPLLPL